MLFTHSKQRSTGTGGTTDTDNNSLGSSSHRFHLTPLWVTAGVWDLWTSTLSKKIEWFYAVYLAAIEYCRPIGAGTCWLWLFILFIGLKNPSSTGLQEVQLLNRTTDLPIKISLNRNFVWLGIQVNYVLKIEARTQYKKTDWRCQDSYYCHS